MMTARAMPTSVMSMAIAMKTGERVETMNVEKIRMTIDSRSRAAARRCIRQNTQPTRVVAI